MGGRLIERLKASGWEVRALARSGQSAQKVKALGATVVEGDLGDRSSLRRAVTGCEVVFHVAAHFKLWGTAQEFETVNVKGTEALLTAAFESACVRRFVQVGAAAVVMGDMAPMTEVNESLPLQERSWAPYSASKARAETLVRGANRPGSFETIVIRPPMIWGKGMPTLDHIVENVRKGQFRWVGSGAQPMSTAHVDNVCLAAELAADKGQGGQAYFVSDGKDSTLRQVIAGILEARGIPSPNASVPLPLAWAMATFMETFWKTFGRSGEPPLTRQMLRLIGQPFTVDITRARRELGYEPLVSWQQGIAQMSAR